MKDSQPLLFHLMLKQEFKLVYVIIKRFTNRKCLKIKLIITEMAQEISPICDFLFGSIRTSLLTGTVDVELTVRKVKGIYTYRKDHTSESTIFTPCSKKVISFASLRRKIQAYQDDKRSEMVLPWNNGNTFQFSVPPMTQNNSRKRAPGKVRARWSNRSRYNPMKAKRPNTPGMTMTNLDIIDVDKKVPLTSKRYATGMDHLAHSASRVLLIPYPKGQTGQIKIGMGQEQRHEKRQGKLTYYWIEICPNPNLSLIQNQR